MDTNSSSIKKSLSQHVSRWSRINGIPVKSLFDYLPARFEASRPNDLGSRQLIWRFKRDFKHKDTLLERIVTFFTGKESKAKTLEKAEYAEDQQIITAELEELISETFHEDVVHLMFMPIPCVNQNKYNERFSSITETVCNTLNMENGFTAISYSDIKTSQLLDNVVLDFEKVMGRHILLFDDIITTGRAAAKMKDILENFGADVVALVTISKTKIPST